MLRSLVRLRATLLGNSLSISTVQPNSQNYQFVLRYSTATVGKTVNVKSMSCSINTAVF